MDIQGSFFSPWDIDAGGYGGNVTAYYLNIKNPAPEGIAYKALNRFKGQNGAGIKAREYLEYLGYDGVNNSDEEYIAFRPEQIKRIDNINPTLNPDTRYSTVSHISDYAWAEENGIINYDDIRVIDEVAEKYMRYHSDVRKIGDEHFYADLGKKIVVMHEIDDHCEIDYVFTSDKSIEKVDIQKIGGYLTNVRTGSRASRIAQSILKTANLRVYAAEDSRQVPSYRNGRGSRKTSIRDYLEDQERRDFLEDSGEFEHKFSTVNSTQLALENPDVYDEIQMTYDEILQKTRGKDLEAALLKMYERSGRKIDRLIEDRRNAIKNYSE